MSVHFNGAFFVMPNKIKHFILMFAEREVMLFCDIDPQAAEMHTYKSWLAAVDKISWLGGIQSVAFTSVC